MTPAERMRQHQRSLQKAQRELEREKAKLEQQEKKTMADIKKNAKAGNMVSGCIGWVARDCCALSALLSASSVSFPVRFANTLERMQDSRQRPCADETVYAKVYSNAGAASSGLVADADAKK